MSHSRVERMLTRAGELDGRGARTGRVRLVLVLDDFIGTTLTRGASRAHRLVHQFARAIYIPTQATSRWSVFRAVLDDYGDSRLT